jgi:ABC-type polysaccharide/polyol phosphate export permease
MLPVYDVLLTMWMYLTPIIYPIEILPPAVIPLFKLNPMYVFLEIFRQPLMNGIVPPMDIWGLAVIYAVVGLIVGGIVFASRSNEYVYRI